ncbi:hypothetical protein BGC_01150 [Burkholderia sp. 3C]
MSVALLALPNAVNASANKCQSPYKIFFSNGVLNTIDDMVAAREVIASQVGSQFNGVPVDYSNMANQTGGIIDDLMRVYKQKLSENPNLTWTILMRAVVGLSTGIDPSLFSQAQQAVAEVNANSASRIGGDVASTTAYADANVQTQVAQVTSTILNDGTRVLIVAHSQGNLYSNAVYQRAISAPGVKPANIKVIGVASPAAQILGGGSYLTSDSDVVIGALRLATGNVLPANVSVPFNPDDISGHLFLKTYMKGSLPLRGQIFSAISSTLPQIEEPESTYDWLVKQRVAISAGWGGGEQDASFIPSQVCSAPWSLINYCQEGGSTDFLKNAAGAYFDPKVQFYSAESTKALNRLLPYSADASNPDSGLYRLIMGVWPMVSAYTQIEETYNGAGDLISSTTKWGSNYYDASMNFSMSPPDPQSYPTNFSETFPRTHVVYHAKLEDSVRNAVNSLPPGKAVLEVYDEGSSIKSVPGWPELQFAVVNRMVKLKICKPIPAA